MTSSSSSSSSWQDRLWRDPELLSGPAAEVRDCLRLETLRRKSRLLPTFTVEHRLVCLGGKAGEDPEEPDSETAVGRPSAGDGTV